MVMDITRLLLDIGIGVAAFRLAWSVDRTQKAMLLIQTEQTKILGELKHRVEKLEERTF